MHSVLIREMSSFQGCPYSGSTVYSLVISLKFQPTCYYYFSPFVAGSMVKSFIVGDEVAGILSLDSECPGCAEYCTIPEYYLIKKPVSVSHADCAASLRGGVRALMALAYQTRLEPGAIALVCSAATGEGIILLQLCEALGVKVCVQDIL